MKGNWSTSLEQNCPPLLNKNLVTPPVRNYGSISTPPESTSLNVSGELTGIPMTMPTGTTVVFIKYPNKRGVIIESSKVESYCTKHAHKTMFYLLQMDWSSTWWLRILHCIYFSFKWIFYFPFKWFVFYPCKWLIYYPCKWLLQKTGVISCISRPFKPFILRDVGILQWYTYVMGGCLSIMGRNRKVCPQDVEDEASFEQRMRTAGGIQGFNNSCHLDAFLFSMYYSSTAFDSILDNNHEPYSPVGRTKTILKDEIVHPLRQKGYVTAKQVWKLRKLLETFNPKITGSFMAIEDIVYLLFEKALNLPKFLHYTVGHLETVVIHSEYMHIMCASGNDIRRVVTTQHVLRESMQLLGNMRFQKVPSPALILSLPWQGNKFFHYDAIIPSFELEILSLMTNSEFMCAKCGVEIATWEATNFDQVVSIPFLCDGCVSLEQGQKYLSRKTMTLTAVICYRGEHFTTFVRKLDDKSEKGYRWLRFDSMSGNYSTIVPVEDLVESVNYIVQEFPEGGKLLSTINHHAKAFCLDGHTCIYEPVFNNSI